MIFYKVLVLFYQRGHLSWKNLQSIWNLLLKWYNLKYFTVWWYCIFFIPNLFIFRIKKILIPIVNCWFFSKIAESSWIAYFSILPIQSPSKPIFFSYTSKYRSDLSKKWIFGPLGPKSTKLQAFKVCAGRESNPGRSESSDSLYELRKTVASNPKCLIFFFKANFDSLQFLSPWV